MKTIYLQSSLKFGETLNSVSDYEYRRLRENFDSFLKKSLQLGFFVPTDLEGNILEPLKGCCSGSDCGCMGMPVNVGSIEEMNEVLEAESKLLFKGFEYVSETKETWLFKINGNFPRIISKKGVVEFLNMFKDKIQLTDSAIQKIGL